MQSNPGGTQIGPAARRRGGRPPADQAGEADRRILDAATRLFLESGFDATSCDQVLALAGAGKATLYARYANKEALFFAVISRAMARASLPVLEIKQGMPVRERLRAAGRALLVRALADEAVELMRVCLAIARRMPDCARMADRSERQSAVECVVLALAGEAAAEGKGGQAAHVAELFVDMVFVAPRMRVLMGDDRERLDATGARRVDEAVDLLARAGWLDEFGTP